VAANLAEGIAVLDKRANLARVFIHLYIAAATAMMLTDLGLLSGAFTLEDESILAMLGLLAYSAVFFIYLGSVVFIAMWIHRAHANLVEAGLQGLEYTPGWSVGWFFVPFANLIMPFRAMRELWNRSHGDNDSFTGLASSDLGAWWGCFLAGNILSNISARMDFASSGSLQEAGLFIGFGGTAILVGAAWFLMKIIAAITSAQHSMMGIAETFS
jgi:hypothetical protein